MRGVYMVYVMRQIGQPMVRTGLFAAALVLILSFVSVPHVIANISGVGSVTGLAAFFLSAFLKTEFFVQIAVLIAGLVAVGAIIDTIKNLASAGNTQIA